MTNIFEIEEVFKQDENNGHPQIKEKSSRIDYDIANDLKIICKKHGVKATNALVEELSSLWVDPPPWFTQY